MTAQSQPDSRPLLPCPFCGSATDLQGSGSIMCSNIQCSVICGVPANSFRSDHDPVAIWNTRIRGEAVAAREWPAKLTGKLACILEDCDPPENQTPEAVAALIVGYQRTWDRILAALPSEAIGRDDGEEMDDFIRAVLADNNPRSDEPYATVAKWIRLIRLAYPVPEKASTVSRPHHSGEAQ